MARTGDMGTQAQEQRRGQVQHAKSRFAESSRCTVVVGVGLAACLLALFGALCTGDARAEITHKFDSNIAPGTLSNPTSLAVDQATGDIVVLDGSKLFKFTAAGSPSNFSSVGKNELTLSCGSLCRNVAIDNSGGVNQSVIYVSSQEETPANGGRQIRVFLSTGEQADSIENWSTGERSHSYCGVATDQKGQVYVAHNQGYESSSDIPGGIADGTSYVDKLKPGRWVPQANDQNLVWPIQATMIGLFPNPNGGNCRVAANSKEDLYYSFYSEYEGGITPQIRRSPHTAYGAIPGPPVVVVDNASSAFTVDHSDDELYSDRKDQIARFDSSNTLRETFGGAVGQLEESSFGVAINETNGTVYATNTATDKVSVFKAVVSPDVSYNDPAPLQTTADVSGKVGLAGAGNVTDCVVEYGTTTAYSSPPVKCTPDASGAPFISETEVSAHLTGLSKETLYHYRISATNSNATTQGVDGTFTTHNVAGVTTDDATAVTQSSATLNGTFTGNGDATSVSFQWGASTSYGFETPSLPVGAPNGVAHVSVPLEGLAVYTPDAGTYHYRLVASNSSGTSFGADRVFSTEPPLPPAISNANFSALTETAATLSADVNPGNGATSVTFEYGPGSEYGNVAFAPGSIGSDDTDHPVTAELGGLTPGTTYHFRVVASNFGGTSHGLDQTFRTASSPSEAPFEPPVANPPSTPQKVVPTGTGSCGALSQKAKKERSEAARLRRSAAKAPSAHRARALRKTASQRSKKARQLEKQATSCRAGGKG